VRITYRTALRNIRKLYAEIPQADRDASVNWYLRAHNEIKAIGARYPWYEAPIEAYCHVVAALSPGVKWQSNLEDFAKLLELMEGDPNGTLLPWFKPRTYPAQKDKAITILSRARHWDKSGHWSEVLKGPKERAFAHNLAYPEAERELTLDFHAYSIACNTRWTSQSVPQFKVAERAAIDRAYRKVAEENKLKACQLQAITWEWWRKTRPAPRFHKTKGKVIEA